MMLQSSILATTTQKLPQMVKRILFPNFGGGNFFFQSEKPLDIYLRNNVLKEFLKYDWFYRDINF